LFVYRNTFLLVRASVQSGTSPGSHCLQDQNLTQWSRCIIIALGDIRVESRWEHRLRNWWLRGFLQLPEENIVIQPLLGNDDWEPKRLSTHFLPSWSISEHSVPQTKRQTSGPSSNEIATRIAEVFNCSLIALCAA
jgi:hypothetical protein